MNGTKNGIHKDAPVVIEVDEEERLSGVASFDTIRRGVLAMHADGVVVLNNVIDTKELDILNERMCIETQDLLARPTTHYNFKGTGNVSQVPPMQPHYLFKDIIANPIAGAILENVLGPKPELRYMHGNTALKGVGRQPVHADLMFDHLDHPFGIVANVMLVDTNLEQTDRNGATEVWLGTHRNTTIADHIAPDVPPISQKCLDERAQVRPPIRPFIKRGSIVLRDLRTWHAGIANTTDVPRIMLAVLHFASWYGNRLTLKLPESSRAKVEAIQKDAKVNICADYLPDEGYDHLAIQFDANFSETGGHKGAEIFGDDGGAEKPRRM